MTTLHRHLILLLASLPAATLCGALLGGSNGALTALSLTLALWLIRHLIQIARLQHWLANPKLRHIPQSSGLWQDIYDTLLRQAKTRKKRKQKLTQTLQRFTRAAETLPDGIIILDPHKRIDWMNRLAADHLHLQDSDRGNILPNLVRHPEFHRLLQQPREHTHTLKLTLPHSKQPRRTLQLILTPFDENDQLLISQDISSAEQLDTSRTAFVANVSHELRTPLTVINGFLETFADHPDLPAAQRREFTALMQQEGRRMLNLLNDLLTLARLEAPGSDSPAQPLNLSRLVETVTGEARNLSQNRHHIHTDIAPGLWINGYDSDLHSALGNLVSNAVRYTPAGGDIRIRLTHDNHAQQATFAVEDSGPGIAAEHLPHLTERFYRVDAGRSRNSGGTGLGLAISKHALAKHHTRLEIDSRLHQGSTFSVRFATLIPPPDKPNT